MLESLEVATVFFSEETNVSISVVLPVIYGLITKLAVEIMILLVSNILKQMFPVH